MEIHYTAYFLLMALATFGAIFAPRVRNFCIWLLFLSGAGYLAKVGLSGIFGENKDGFLLSMIDVTIGGTLVGRFSKIHYRLCACMFALASYTHFAMTSAYVAQEANMFYTNYELIIAATSIIQAVLIFGGYYRDAYRNIADRLRVLPHIHHCNTNNKISKKIQ